MRKHVFETGGFYHIFNRGVDKRDIFIEHRDKERFLQSMEEFNTAKPIGSIYENSFVKNRNQLGNRVSKLVNISAFCLNPNHFHMLLEQVQDNGISAFMHRLGLGYTKYFNTKHRRSGTLFQGKFKSVPIISNEQLLHVSAYINLNDRAHSLKSGVVVSSWGEYIDARPGLCSKNNILGQFDRVAEYRDFAESTLVGIIERKALFKDLEQLILE